MDGSTDQITDELVQQCQVGYRQFRENDPAFLATIDPDIEWHVPDTLPGGGALHGQLELLEFTETVSGLWEDAHPDPAGIPQRASASTSSSPSWRQVINRSGSVTAAASMLMPTQHLPA